MIEAIESLPLPEQLTLDDIDDVMAARDAYDALDSSQKPLVTNFDKLAAAETRVAELVADQEAAAAADEFRMMYEIPLGFDVETVGINDKDTVEATMAAYENLPEAVQAKLADEKELLDSLLARIEQLEEEAAADQEAAEAVEALIEALPAVEDLTLDDMDTVEAARDAYDALTLSRKALVTNLDKLAAAETRMVELVADQEAADEANNFRETHEEALDLTPETVSIDDRNMVEAALESYENLPEAVRAKLTEEKALIDNLLAKIEQLEQEAAEDQEAAETVEDQIEALPSVENLTLDNKDAVEAARDAYDALTLSQKALVTNLDKLAAAETRMAELVADQEAADEANNFRETHEEALTLTVETVSIDDRNKVEAALESYENLPEAVQAKLTDEKELLDSLFAKIEQLDQQAAGAVEALIEALPAVEDLTLDDMDDVEAARDAYDALTPAQKMLVTNLDKLAAAETRMAELVADQEAAAAADEFRMMYDIPLGFDVETVGINDKDTVEAALAAFESLPEAVQAKLTDEKELLDSLLARIEQLELEDPLNQEAAGAVDALIDALPAVENLTLDDMGEVEAARNAYDALTPAQKMLVTNLDKLAAAETRMAELVADQEAAGAVEALIEALPAVEDLTLDDMDDVEAARDAYDALTAAQQALVTNLDKLAAAETRMAELVADQEAAGAVDALIEALPAVEDLTLDDMDDVEAARDAYDALTAARKALVTNLDKLAAAETRIEELVADQQAAAAADEFRLTYDIPLGFDVETVGINDKDTVEAALAAFESLPEAVQAKLTDEKELLDSLLARIEQLEEKAAADQAAAEEVEALIEALPAVEDLTLDDMDTVEAARDAYEALTPSQQVLVTNLDKLAAAETRIAELVADQEAAAAADEFRGMCAYALGLSTETVTMNDRDAVEAALIIYENLPEAVQAKLADEKELLDSLLAWIVQLEEEAAADQAAAEEVEELIEALPAVEDLTLDDMDDVEIARDAYEALTPSQQLLVTNLDKLVAAETRMAELVADQEATDAANSFRETHEEVLDLTPETVSTDDRNKVETALAAFENLPEAVQAKLADEKELLDSLLARIGQIDQAAAEEVEELIDELPAVEDLTLDDMDDVEAARDAYEALTPSQQALVTNLDKLAAAETRMAELVADQEATNEANHFRETHEEALALTVETVSFDDRSKVETALAAFENLPEAVQAKLADEKELLDNLLAKIEQIDQEVAGAVDALIEALPAVEDLTLDDMDDVEAARDAYEALTPSQQLLVTSLDRLLAAEARIAELKITVDWIGDETIGEMNVVNREYRDNNVKSAPIGPVTLKIGHKDVTADFDFAFYDKENGSKLTQFDLSRGGSTFRVYMEATSDEYNDVSAYVVFKYGSVTIGNNDTYFTIEDALENASSGTIHVKYNTAFADSDVAEICYGTTDHTLKKGVTVLLPYSEAFSSKIDDYPSGTGGAITRNSAYVDLHVPCGIEVDVKGTLIVNAMRASYGTRFAGHVTTNNYAQLHLEQGSKITVENDGTLSCMGFIYGDGEVEALSGSTLNDSLFIQSFRGGSATLNVQSDVFPFDQFTINNIETDLIINSGAIYNAKTLIYVNSKYYGGNLALVGSNKKSLIQLTGGRLIKSYDTGSGIVTFDFRGDASINISSIDISGIKADSDGKDMPFDGTWKFVFSADSNIDIASWMALLPGGQMYIEEGANVTIKENGRLGVFDPYEHLDDYNAYPVNAKAYYRVAPSFGYGADTPGTLVVDGTLTVEGGLAGRVHVGDTGLLDQKGTAYDAFDYKYVIGSAKDADSNSREFTLWEEGDDTIAVVAKPSKVVTKDQTQTTLTATVKDANNNPMAGIEVIFSGGKGVWSSTSVITDSNGRAVTTYTTDANETQGKLTLTATEQEGNKTARANLDVKASGGSSCPFVYSYDGQGYCFEHEAIPFAVNKALETTSHGTLRELKGVDGRYHLRIAEILDEKSFVHGFKLTAVDYAEGQGATEVFADIFGQPHTIEERIKPIEFVDSDGCSRLDEICTKGQMVSSDSGKLEQGEYVTAYTATFDKPRNVGDRAKLMVSVKKTPLITQSWEWVLDKLDAVNNMWWVETIMNLPENNAKFKDFINMVNLRVELWDGESWVEQGHIMAGMDLLEDFLVPLDITPIDGMDEVKVRFVSGTGFYEFDCVSIDFSADQISNVVELEPEVAVFNGEEDVKAILADFDDNNGIRMLQGDKIDLYYTIPEIEEGHNRGFMVTLKGYYHADPDTRENPVADEWADMDTAAIIEMLYTMQDEDAIAAMPDFLEIGELVDSLYNTPLEEKIERTIVGHVLPWLNGLK